MGLDIYIRKASKRNHEKTACEAWDYESTARRRSLKRFMDKVDRDTSTIHDIEYHKEEEDMGQYVFDVKGFTNELMPDIHNSNLPREIKDAWCEFAVTLNVGDLKEHVDIEED